MTTLADLIDSVVNGAGYRSPVVNAIANQRPDLPAVKAWERQQALANAVAGPQGNAQDQMAGAYAPQTSYLGEDVAEFTGLPSLVRGGVHLNNSLRAGRDYQRSADEAGAALPDIALGGLGVLGMLGGSGESLSGPRAVPQMPMQQLNFGRLWESEGAPIVPHDLAFDGARGSYPEGALNNDLDRWVMGGIRSRASELPTLIERQRGFMPGHDMESLIRMANHTRPGEFANILDTDLGEFGVGGKLEGTPLLGTPDIAADPLANTARPGFTRLPELPQRMANRADARWPMFGTLPPEPVTPLPVNPTRELGRAADGSVLPVRPAQPFRQSFVGGSGDLRDAAGLGGNDGGQSLPEGDAGGAFQRLPNQPGDNPRYVSTRLEEGQALVWPKDPNAPLSTENTGGYIQYDPSRDGQTWTIHYSQVDPSLQGGGHGVAMYEELFNRARRAGVTTIRSDQNVSPQAVNVWAALRRRGYRIENWKNNEGLPTFYARLEPQSVHNVGQSSAENLNSAGSDVAPPARRTPIADALLGRSPEMPTNLWIGPKSALWDVARTNRAEQMEARGASARDIWRETQTFRGTDGKWRQETGLVPFSQAYPNARSHMLPEFFGDGGSFLPLGPLNIVAGNDARVLSHELNHLAARIEGFAPGGNPLVAGVQAKLRGEPFRGAYDRLPGEIDAERAAQRYHLNDEQRLLRFPGLEDGNSTNHAAVPLGIGLLGASQTRRNSDNRNTKAPRGAFFHGRSH